MGIHKDGMYVHPRVDVARICDTDMLRVQVAHT
jgi:hypothetical protein